MTLYHQILCVNYFDRKLQNKRIIGKIKRTIKGQVQKIIQVKVIVGMIH